jgi:hypothetical protein
MIVCSRKEDFIGDKAKTGYHLIFPDLYVNLKIANDTVHYIINQLNEISPSYTWNKIIDSKVYKSGLRMIGSTKGKQSKMIYMPRNTYGYSENYLDENIEKYVFDCSVRALSEEFEPIFPVFKEYTYKNDLYTTPKISNTLQEYEALPTDKLKDFIDEVERFILTFPKPLNKEWSNIRNISRVLIAKDKSSYLFQPGSKYCTNKGTWHAHNHIYLMISPSGLKQKCYSTNNYRFGSCGNYISTNYPLSERAFKGLFPGKKQFQIAPYDDKRKLFKSVSMIKKDRKSYLKSSLLTIQHLEQGLK